ncbi:helix-turn-helix transcriptional regulator [Limosilactobacillus sp. STM2_1]|uniref:Helix-turn-helix transcriptional regulator n=1 Tax=Limosilactobacillus rudii TaxID=2759755 RepID=A0A7W3UL48_9LACO|nr:helix-turn-helix domain-containing protein [Limosilactobacillus rudii]MBB1079555.1 helix-turn-helix transcriptional regulator [Limosilactobacillus rudii]MBB1097601.1 helix-turn-helix transcriptional regulator [Limosilactobacillus rudii]MCD7134710.1 helix-turn-helix transcriptional regulator [Limosilactobacillus rudii]
MEEYNLGVYYILKIINGKWKPSIICFLGAGKNRYGELLRHVNAVAPTKVSKKVLTQQLKQLMADQIIQRKDFKGDSPHVEYSLTNEGEQLRRMIIKLSKFGEKMAHQLSTPENPINILYLYDSEEGKLPLKNLNVDNKK